MNDDFLRRAWRRPPATFERQLRERLRQQELASPPRRRPTWTVLIASVLIGGSALATVTYLTVKHLSSVSRTAEVQATSETVAPLARSARNASGAWYSTGPAASATLSGERQQTSATSVRDAAGAAIDARDSDPSIADSSSTGAPSSTSIASSSAESVGDRSVRVALTPELAVLSDGITASIRYRAQARAEITSADDALKGLCADADELPRWDVALVSRRIHRDELNACKSGLREAKLGHMAMVITGAKAGNKMRLSADTIALALLKRVPAPDDPDRLIDNPYTDWNQIDRSLERRRIEVSGPPRDSQHFLLFAATILEPACERIRALQTGDSTAYRENCHTLRDDGVYKEAAWDITFVGQRLWADPNIVAVIDYSFYSANSADLLGSMLNGPAPTPSTIMDGSYPGARTLYLYVSPIRIRNIREVSGFVDDYLRRRDYTHHRWIIPSSLVEQLRPYEPLPLSEIEFE
ncbi:hypothetical protein JM946_19000 [Steroidobacter sp. S1-65]|uniref:PBP domain-containing protein n=1 Tax=Steroidobacter gossypii TaxID=2805490 RepID=A0ABS1X0Y1_9GAMM|nr:substrate-binding domain-containing protein [Steroidobacter gossypii]MBM0106827.1 hypothetical protein [Steroidobacter gossypii]